jgi:outer membrane protein OmpA-like peptidoglycan-associated protein
MILVHRRNGPRPSPGHYKPMKKTSWLALFLLPSSLVFAVQSSGGAAAASSSSTSQTVLRTVKAINYRQAGSAKVDFRATEAMQGAGGEAKVQSRTGHIEVELKVTGLEPANKFGLEYLTYVAWALSPQGRAVNLGELVLDHGNSKLRATTELQTFGMIVTAEPYFAVTQPGNLVVLENIAEAGGRQQDIDFSYELLGRGAYSATNARIDNAIFGIDPRTPLELFEARNAVRIARAANADKYAASVLAKADQSLAQAETAYRQKQNKTAVATFAREAAQIAEDARVMSVKKQEQERASRDAADREAKARADAEAETRRRKEAEDQRARAEQERLQAQQARAEAERMKQEAVAAAQEAQKAKAEAEAARAAALAQQQQLAAEAAKAKQAANQADQLRQQADQLRQQAEKEKADLRSRLLQQLNSVLETRDSARGLIANMGDVLFESGKYALRPAARERLARISGILAAHAGLKVAIEGHTDSVGGDDYNQKLSEQRAQAVREYLVTAGVPDDAATARGFGKTQPIASNDTPDGRQRNRRVELVVSGEAIGASKEL